MLLISPVNRFAGRKVERWRDPCSAEEMDPGTQGTTGKRRVRLVLAEDDSSLRELLASALERDGYEVVQASTGNELIEFIRGIVSRGEEVDLLISDVRMPTMSGLLALKLIRDAELRMPVILITAFSDLWTQREAAEYGAVLLDKPVHLRTLRDSVKRALEHGDGSNR